MHLFTHTVYHDHDPVHDMETMFRSIRAAGADGMELLTGYAEPDHLFKGIVKGVHLPYATDWHSAWNGTDTSELSDDEVKFVFLGRDREDMVRNVRDAIRYASVLEPEYGVFHGSSVRLDEIFGKPSDNDGDVIKALAEMMNSVVSEFKDNEPPFTIMFENLWWSGLKLLDASEYRILENKLEFDDWGFCLDTGHLMNALGNCTDEGESIDAVVDVVSEYPCDMASRIYGMHLHLSTSADFVRTYAPPKIDGDMGIMERLSMAYGYVSKLDQHRPFTSPSCKQIVDIVDPEFLTHEIVSDSWDSRLSDFSAQRGFF